jgi:glycosyltransferase involved in cell wall biosynthesis
MAKNSIYFVFTLPPVSGGHFVALEHIAALNRMGFNAKVYYVGAPDGFDKFTVPAVRAGAPLLADDIIVVGEDHKALLKELKNLSCIKVLHHQAFFYTFAGFDSIAELIAYPFARVIVASDFCATRLKALGVTQTISRVRPAVPKVFAPGEKRLQIAYAPHKRPIEANFLRGYFGARFGEYAHVPWVPLINMSRADCAKVMGEACVYAALPLLESLGLMNLEGMASGCHVVGYTGHGGAEYATPQNGDWIADGDHDAFVEKLRDACRLYESKQPNPKITAGRVTAAQFSRAGFEQELRETWLAIMGDRAELYRTA